MLFVAWWLPLIETNHLLQWSPDNLSVLDGLARLYSDGELFLAGVILVLAILVPFAKNLLSLFVWYFLDPTETATKRFVWILSVLGKWGMADVFLIALGVVLVKGIPGTEISVRYGLWVFSAAVACSILSTNLMSWIEGRIENENG